MGIVMWIIIAIFIVLGLIFVKTEHHTRKVKILIIIVIGFLIYFTLMSTLSSRQADLTSPRGIVSVLYSYVGWIGKTLGNIWDIGKETVTAVGNAIKTNSTG